MKNTGVVRRIDELGRIVIPKEIRRSLRIKDGESLEIFLDSDNIVLKKYSSFDNLTEFYKKYVDSVNSIIKKNILITDRDVVVAVAGEIKKEYYGKNISKFLENIIQNRENSFSKEPTGVEIIKGLSEKASYAASPIIVNGDAVGTVVILNIDGKITDNEEKIVSIASKFLGKYSEE